VPRDRLERTSPKWPISCRVGRKTLTQSYFVSCRAIRAVRLIRRSRYEQVVTGRGLDGPATSEQFSEGGDGGSLEAADRRVRVGAGPRPASCGGGEAVLGRPGLAQSDLSRDAHEQLVHAVIEQRRHLDELAVTPRRHVLTVCTARPQQRRYGTQSRPRL